MKYTDALIWVISGLIYVLHANCQATISATFNQTFLFL